MQWVEATVIHLLLGCAANMTPSNPVTHGDIHNQEDANQQQQLPGAAGSTGGALFVGHPIEGPAYEGMEALAAYDIEATPWNTTKLTWCLVDEAWADATHVAFDVWGRHSALQFFQVSCDEADLVLTFEMGDHGDGAPFDGPGGTLAHAYYPAYGGDIHFDAAETWGTEGYDYETVAIHEIGHAIGIRHSDDPDALMYPYYNGPNWILGEDDVAAVTELYDSGPCRRALFEANEAAQVARDLLFMVPGVADDQDTRDEVLLLAEQAMDTSATLVDRIHETLDLDRTIAEQAIDLAKELREVGQDIQSTMLSTHRMDSESGLALPQWAHRLTRLADAAETEATACVAGE